MVVGIPSAHDLKLRLYLHKVCVQLGQPLVRILLARGSSDQLKSPIALGIHELEDNVAAHPIYVTVAPFLKRRSERWTTTRWMGFYFIRRPVHNVNPPAITDPASMPWKRKPLIRIGNSAI